MPKGMGSTMNIYTTREQGTNKFSMCYKDVYYTTQNPADLHSLEGL